MNLRTRVLAVCTVIGAVIGGTAWPASAAGTVEGAGSSFPQLEIEQWRSDVAKKPYNLKINYVSSGSTFGRQQFIQNSVDFGVSDIAFQVDELPQVKDRSYTYVTVSAGGVGFMYNLRDRSGKRIGFTAANGGNDKQLKLSPRTVCRLFSEPGMRWNDSELQAENPDIQLPDKAVSPVFRADGSGTGFVVQEFCIATAPDVWQKFVAYVNATPVLRVNVDGDPFVQGKPSSKWPVFAGQSAFAGDGVANVVASSAADASITYVEAGFAEVRGFPNALVKNAAGVYHYPESTNVNVALKYAKRNPDATVTLDYVTQDPDAYFPSSYSYAIVPTAGIDSSKGKDLATFLNYAVTTGQEKADRLGYAPLSKEIVEISLDEIIKIPGAPPKPVAVTFDPLSGGTGGGGSSGGGSSGGGSSGGGVNGGGTADGSAGGGTTDGATGGGSRGGTSDGSTGGGSVAGDTAVAGGAATGGGSRAGGAAGATGGAASGATGSGATAGSGASGTRTGGTGVPTQVAGQSVSRTAGANPTIAGAATEGVVTTATKPPSNSEVLITMLQGAALCGAAYAVAKRLQRRTKEAV